MPRRNLETYVSVTSHGWLSARLTVSNPVTQGNKGRFITSVVDLSEVETDDGFEVNECRDFGFYVTFDCGLSSFDVCTLTTSSHH